MRIAGTHESVSKPHLLSTTIQHDAAAEREGCPEQRSAFKHGRRRRLQPDGRTGRDVYNGICIAFKHRRNLHGAAHRLAQQLAIELRVNSHTLGDGQDDLPMCNGTRSVTSASRGRMNRCSVAYRRRRQIARAYSGGNELGQSLLADHHT